ncbi:MAG: hypothetical protein U0Q03_10440 [Acidimicrobiales bacterium]
MRRPLVALFVLPALFVVACGGDDEPSRADTAEKGSEFCDRAAVAETRGDEVNQVGTDPAKVEPAVKAALESADAALELAPTDVVEVMTRVVDYQHRVADLLEANGWDLVATYATDEGAALFGDDAAQADRDSVRAYLEEKCGIVDDSTTDTSDTTATSDASGSSGSDVDLPDGDAGIDRFIDLYAIGAGTEVTDEQRTCVKDELRDEVTIEQLELLVAGGVDEDTQVAVGLAFIRCDIMQAG